MHMYMHMYLHPQERQKIAEAEEALARRRKVVSELALRSKAVALQANSLAAERTQLMTLQQERREQLRQVGFLSEDVGRASSPDAIWFMQHCVCLCAEAVKTLRDGAGPAAGLCRGSCAVGFHDKQRRKTRTELHLVWPKLTTDSQLMPSHVFTPRQCWAIKVLPLSGNMLFCLQVEASMIAELQKLEDKAKEEKLKQVGAATG